jgi:dTDP-4-dehydrorhamnose 3,5-epimerase
MNYTKTSIPDVWIIEPVVFKDSRGYFMEIYKQADFEQHIGKIHFIQENESCSTRGVLR